MAKRGVKPLSSRDWLFGSRPRRLAIAALLTDPHRVWSKAALARATGVSVHGGIDDQVAGLRRVGLLVGDEQGWRLAEPDGRLAATLAELLQAIGELPDDDGPAPAP